jgi:hypothetical protein
MKDSCRLWPLTSALALSHGRGSKATHTATVALISKNCAIVADRDVAAGLCVVEVARRRNRIPLVQDFRRQCEGADNVASGDDVEDVRDLHGERMYRSSLKGSTVVFLLRW